MHKSVIVLILVSLGTSFFNVRTACAPAETVLAVVNMGSVDAPSKWTAGTPRWKETNIFLFYTNETTNDDTFYIGIKTYNAVDLLAWQFKLWFNASLLNCTDVWKPGWWIFAGYPFVDAEPTINNTEGYVMYGSSLLGGPGFFGNGTLCQIGFQIMKEPTDKTASLECDLTFASSDTIFLDSNLEVVETQYIPGHYEYTWVPTQVRESVHNLDTGLNYTTIQEGINADETLDGHTIFVEEGIYYEHLVVNKAVSLIGQNRQTTIIDGNMTEDVVRITQDHVDIRGFTIQKSGHALFNSGISISSTGHCDISGNRIVNSEVGVYGSPENASISNNTVTNNHIGIAIDPGATCNIISRNRLRANTVSLHIYNANSNTIFENNMTNNWRSITLGYSRNNRLYHNNFFNNTEPILILASGYANFWDDGHSSGGNYWSDYNGSDSNNDGIGDIPYVLDGNNTDNYPLMGVFHSFNTSLGKHVNVISNSTIKDFEYDESSSTIKLYVSNMTVNQTTGFCRLTIPHALMNVTNIKVIIDNGTKPLLYHNQTLFDNGTHRWIYFAYEHSTLEIIIVPELPSFLVLPLFMIATLLAVIVYRRKQTR